MLCKGVKEAFGIEVAWILISKQKNVDKKNPDKTYQKHNVDLQINDVKTKSGKACKELEALRAKIGPKFYRNLN